MNKIHLQTHIQQVKETALKKAIDKQLTIITKMQIKLEKEEQKLMALIHQAEPFKKLHKVNRNNDRFANSHP